VFPNGATFSTLTVPDIRDWTRNYFNCHNSFKLTSRLKKWFPWETMSSPSWKGGMWMIEIIFKVFDATGWWIYDSNYIEHGGLPREQVDFFGSTSRLHENFPEEYCDSSHSDKTQCTFFGRSCSYCSTILLNVNPIPLVSGDIDNEKNHIFFF